MQVEDMVVRTGIGVSLAIWKYLRDEQFRGFKVSVDHPMMEFPQIALGRFWIDRAIQDVTRRARKFISPGICLFAELKIVSVNCFQNRSTRKPAPVPAPTIGRPFRP